jgi:hypothetical protein
LNPNQIQIENRKLEIENRIRKEIRKGEKPYLLAAAAHQHWPKEQPSHGPVHRNPSRGQYARKKNGIVFFLQTDTATPTGMSSSTIPTASVKRNRPGVASKSSSSVLIQAHKKSAPKSISQTPPPPDRHRRRVDASVIAWSYK